MYLKMSNTFSQETQELIIKSFDITNISCLPVKVMIKSRALHVKPASLIISCSNPALWPH